MKTIAVAVIFLAMALLSPPRGQAQEKREAPATPPRAQETKAPASPPATLTYKPPLRGAPGGRVGGGTRGTGAGRELFVLSVLAPDHTGLTANPQPVLYWFLSRASSSPVEISLVDPRAVEHLMELRMAPPIQAGVHRVSLAEKGIRLESGVAYQWYVAVVPDTGHRSKDILAGGTVERVDRPAELEARLPPVLLARDERVAEWRVAVVEPTAPRAPQDGVVDLRVSALSRASERILRHAGAREPLEPSVCPYTDMVVWDAAGRLDGRDTLRFSAAESGEPDLGCIAENQRVQWALHGSPWVRGVTQLRAGLESLEFDAESARVTLSDGRRCSAALVVGADGGQSRTRELCGIGRAGWTYGQTAVVAHLRTQLPHRHTAWQRFLPDGPIGKRRMKMVGSVEIPQEAFLLSFVLRRNNIIPQDQVQQENTSQKYGWRRLLPGLIISLLCLAIVIWISKPRQLLLALQQGDLRFILLGIMVCVSWVFIRGPLVWRNLLKDRPSSARLFVRPLKDICSITSCLSDWVRLPVHCSWPKRSRFLSGRYFRLL